MLIDLFERLSSRQKQGVAIAIDAVMLPFALCCALALRHGAWNMNWVQFWPAFAVTLAGVPLFIYGGLYRHFIRYMGAKAVMSILVGITITTMALAAVAYMARIPDLPRSVMVVFWLLAMFYVSVTRLSVRAYAESVVRRNVAKKPVAIYGASGAGAYLAYLLDRGSEYRPVAFIDDDKDKHGGVIQSLPVYPVPALTEILREHVIDQVLWPCRRKPPRSVVAPSRCWRRIRCMCA